MRFLLSIIVVFIATTCFGQVKAVHFNADWNSSNNVEWFNKLGDCDKQSLLIEDKDYQSKYQIAVVPTIIIFDEGEEVRRFQADISFSMVATRKEIQSYIDELIISKF